MVLLLRKGTAQNHRNLHQNFLKINIVLCKYINIGCRNWTFQSQTNGSHHSNQQQQRGNNQQICMNSIESDSLRSNRRGSCTQILPERIISLPIHTLWSFCNETPFALNQSTKHPLFGPLVNLPSLQQRRRFKRALGLPLSQCSSPKKTNSLNSSDWISSTLMSKNLCRWNILKHDYKQKQNSQCSYIDQQLQQYKIFKALLYQKTRTMQKLQNQIKNRMHWVFRLHHLKNRRKSSRSNQSKRLTH